MIIYYLKTSLGNVLHFENKNSWELSYIMIEILCLPLTFGRLLFTWRFKVAHLRGRLSGCEARIPKLIREGPQVNPKTGAIVCWANI